MKFPNVASLALIAALIAALEFIAAGADGVSTEWWIPALVLVLGAVAKALQVYLKRAESEPLPLYEEGEQREMDSLSTPSSVRRWLLD
jgi:hypothetical protein